MESGKSLLKLTWASFWRPSGVNIHRMPKHRTAKWGVSPEKEFEIELSPEEYAIYRRYRFERDMLGQEQGAAAEEAAELDDPEAPAVPADFVDEQLARAVEHLQREMADPAN